LRHSVFPAYIVCVQCWGNNKRVVEEFRCLESTFGDADARDWPIITERVNADSDDRQQIVCWLVTTYSYRYRQHAIYRLTAEQCNSAARGRINAGQLRPATTLVEVRRGAVGWFTVVGRQTATPAGHEQGRTTSEALHAGDDDWSFLDESSIINVYDEPYIATDLDDDEQDGQMDAELYMSNSHQPLNHATVACLLACVYVLRTLC